MSDTELHKVFVYGTLKNGEPNAYWLTDKRGHSKFICKAKTVIKYPLIISTEYNIPFLLFKPDIGYFVKGEIYEVDDVMLSNLDILEEHPTVYTREKQMFKPIDSELTDDIECWVYFLKTFDEEMLKLPMLEDYSSSGGHGLVYCEPVE